MNKLYKLLPDYENYSSFLMEEDSLSELEKYWNWQDINLETYKKIKFKLYNAENGTKNYKFDVTKRDNFLILSEKAVEILKPILEGKGQFLEIITLSKRKKFIGFYPSNVYSNDLADLSKSDWGENEKGKLFFKMIFQKYPQDEYIFVVDGSALTIYATEKFKKLLEDNNLKGLCFEEVSINE